MNKKTAYITGASAGIGKIFAFELAKDFNLVLIARNETKLKEVVNELKSITNVDLIPADLSLSKDIE